MRPRVSLRQLLVLITLGCVLLWYLGPVNAINRRVINRIKPGMTITEAREVVGLPINIYDGIGSWQTNAPDWGKGSMPSWIGINGELVLVIDRNERVIRAEFHRSRIGDWSLTEYVWERITWLQVVRASLTKRIIWYLSLGALGILLFSELFLSANSRNSEAWLGLVGLILGPVLSVAIFGDGLYDPSVPMLLPFASALIGIMIGFARTTHTLQPPNSSDLQEPNVTDQSLVHVTE